MLGICRVSLREGRGREGLLEGQMVEGKARVWVQVHPLSTARMRTRRFVCLRESLRDGDVRACRRGCET